MPIGSSGYSIICNPLFCTQRVKTSLVLFVCFHLMTMTPNSYLLFKPLVLVENLLIQLMTKIFFDHYSLYTLGFEFVFTTNLTDGVHLWSQTKKLWNETTITPNFELTKNLFVFCTLIWTTNWVLAEIIILRECLHVFKASSVSTWNNKLLVYSKLALSPYLALILLYQNLEHTEQHILACSV